MKLEQEILINKYGQGLISIDEIVALLQKNNEKDKHNALSEIVNLIIQTKVTEEDIDQAIVESGLKRTYTPSVLLATKGVANHNLQKIIELPEGEQHKVLKLMLALFKIAYKRRFSKEKNHPDKWWYWDLSNQSVIDKIRKLCE
ncbi:DUF5958 family protein [Pedobacter sp. ASV12]|uniref:DUF5958 family protein n=1 Tax=Pedobacter sp. ASV12 TaxID=2795120 RepID=UPI0018EBC934|nr:DUF5958 family protein [Pedobacter sp. ASV12]